MLRSYLFEAAGVLLTRVPKWSTVKAWGTSVRKDDRDCNIEPSTSPYAIMRRVHPYRGENNGPGKDDRGDLTPRPGIREQNRHSSEVVVPMRDVRSWGKTGSGQLWGEPTRLTLAVCENAALNVIRAI